MKKKKRGEKGKGGKKGQKEGSKKKSFVGWKQGLLGGTAPPLKIGR